MEGPFKGELSTFGENTAESYYGGGLAIQPEGENEGRLIADSEVHEVKTGGILGTLSTAALSFHYKEEAGGKVSVTENGWTGGRPGELGTATSCIIGFAGNYPQVAGATEGRAFVLAPATGEVIEFGPAEHTACPTAKAGEMEALVAGHKLSSVTTTSTVTLSSKVTQGSVLSVQWKFGTEGEETVPTTAGEQTQTAEVQHKFAKPGKVTVEAIIHTDDLATPVLTVKLTLNVEAPTGTPKVTAQPASQTVEEGQPAIFEIHRRLENRTRRSSGKSRPTAAKAGPRSAPAPNTVRPKRSPSRR